MISFFANLYAGFRRRRRAFGRDDSAATAIEFAILSFPFLIIVGGILQTSVVFLATQVLESAVQDSSRQIRIGQAQEPGQTLDTFRAGVCERLYGLFGNCSALHLRVVEVSNFQSATVVVPAEATCSANCEWTIPQSWSPGRGRSVILVQVYYRYPVIIQLGPLGMANMADGSRLLGSATVFQNEPF